MRKGFDDLATLVQQALTKDPFSGQVFVFRGLRGDMVKAIASGKGLTVTDVKGN